MTEATQENLKAKMDDLFDEFNAILASNGLGELTLQNFRLRETPLDCKRTKRVCRNGTCYIICLD